MAMMLYEMMVKQVRSLLIRDVFFVSKSRKEEPDAAASAQEAWRVTEERAIDNPPTLRECASPMARLLTAGGDGLACPAASQCPNPPHFHGRGVSEKEPRIFIRSRL